MFPPTQSDSISRPHHRNEGPIIVAEDQLGGRLPLLDTDTLDDEQRELVDYLMRTFVPWASTTGFRSRTPDGMFIGPFNALLRSPALAGQFLQFQTGEQQHTSLSDRVRQVVILAVGAVWAADYELYAHSAVARHQESPTTPSAALPQAPHPTPSVMTKSSPTASPDSCRIRITSTTPRSPTHGKRSETAESST
jgi:hypothetical protein